MPAQRASPRRAWGAAGDRGSLRTRLPLSSSIGVTKWGSRLLALCVELFAIANIAEITQAATFEPPTKRENETHKTSSSKQILNV